MAISDFKDISDKIFSKLMDDFPLSQRLSDIDIFGDGTMTVEKGRPVNSNPERTKKVDASVKWLFLNEYIYSSGDQYCISEKWLKLKDIDVFS